MEDTLRQLAERFIKRYRCQLTEMPEDYHPIPLQKVIVGPDGRKYVCSRALRLTLNEKIKQFATEH